MAEIQVEIARIKAEAMKRSLNEIKYIHMAST